LGARRDTFGRSRTVRFRRSFLIAFARRIGQRLREAVGTTIDEVGATAGALVPLLDRRRAASVAAAREAFPFTTSMNGSVTDFEGWSAGTALGDRADIGVGRKPHRLSA
jgi:hypothetical protein